MWNFELTFIDELVNMLTPTELLQFRVFIAIDWKEEINVAIQNALPEGIRTQMPHTHRKGILDVSIAEVSLHPGETDLRDHLKQRCLRDLSSVQ